jgi:RimJ/RimL family protein N-acetyltransferase
MEMKLLDPYTVCPVYDTGSFLLRLIQQEDAEDLLGCYSDPESIPLFNSDNCLFGFSMHLLDDMKATIEAWLAEYRARGFVRFSIIDQTTGRVIGTLEFFTRAVLSADGQQEAGILRLDLISGYEREAVLCEILELVESRFGEYFAFNSILTKAVPQAAARISVLLRLGYQRIEPSSDLPYDDYYIKEINSGS